MPRPYNDRLNHPPDKAETALLLIDVINDLEFDAGEKLLTHALPMAVALASTGRVRTARKHDDAADQD
jgi:hypothetical protein